jgi:hypothetical protein
MRLKLFALGLALALAGAGIGFGDQIFFVQLSDTHWGFDNPKVNPDYAGTLKKALPRSMRFRKRLTSSSSRATRRTPRTTWPCGGSE